MEVEPRERAGPVVVEAKGYKLKTRKAAAKRFKVTGSGKVLRRKPGKQHINKHKSTTRLGGSPAAFQGEPRGPLPDRPHHRHDAHLGNQAEHGEGRHQAVG